VDVSFGGVEPFGIDHGQLDGLSPQECFVLGVEWEMVRALAGAPEGFGRPVHAANRGRLAALLDRRGRAYRLTHMHDDPSEGWLWLEVVGE
jgi:hypothetical protein